MSATEEGTAELVAQLEHAASVARALLGTDGPHPAPALAAVEDTIELALAGAAATDRIAGLALQLVDMREELRTIESARHTAALATVQRALATLREPVGAAAVMDRGLAELCRHCGFSRAVLFRVEGAELVGEAIYFTQRRDWAAELLQTTRTLRLPLTHMILETEMLRRRTSALVADPANDERAFAPLVNAFETRSYVAAPVMPEGRVIGFIHADHYFTDGRHVDEIDRDVVAAFAEGFGYALHRAVLLDRLGEQRAEIERMMEAAREAVGAMGDASAEIVRAHEAALRPPALEPVSGIAALLTPREREVLELMAEGHTNAEIARRLVVSEETVKTHVKHVLRKLRAANRAEAVSRYHRLRR